MQNKIDRFRFLKFKFVLHSHSEYFEYIFFYWFWRSLEKFLCLTGLQKSFIVYWESSKKNAIATNRKANTLQTKDNLIFNVWVWRMTGTRNPILPIMNFLRKFPFSMWCYIMYVKCNKKCRWVERKEKKEKKEGTS